MRARKILLESLGAAMDDQWVDRTRRPYVSGDIAYVPVKDGYQADTELKERKPYSGRGYQMIGDIAVFHGKRPSAEELNAVIRWKKPRAALHISDYKGIMRLPGAEVLYGKSCDVVHREEGCTFILDPARVMFAQGNREEKKKMARIVSESEAGGRVADMFAGIGYFTIPMAGSGALVHAMEINPVSFGYLEENIKLNEVGSNVSADLGDCRDLLKGEYERAVMGHFCAHEMLKDILPHMKRGGCIHVHATGCPDTDSAGRNNKMIIDTAQEYGFSVKSINTRKVKKYSPGRWHMVQDVMLK